MGVELLSQHDRQAVWECQRNVQQAIAHQVLRFLQACEKVLGAI